MTQEAIFMVGRFLPRPVHRFAGVMLLISHPRHMRHRRPTPNEYKAVKGADMTMLCAEVRQLMKSRGETWGFVPTERMAEENMICAWSPSEASHRFIQRYNELQRIRNASL